MLQPFNQWPVSLLFHLCCVGWFAWFATCSHERYDDCNWKKKWQFSWCWILKYFLRWYGFVQAQHSENEMGLNDCISQACCCGSLRPSVFVSQGQTGTSLLLPAVISFLFWKKKKNVFIKMLIKIESHFFSQADECSKVWGNNFLSLAL